MCLELRKTVKRGRSAVPVICRRTCWRRRSWRCRLSRCWSMVDSSGRETVNGRGKAASSSGRTAGEGLAFLAAHLFVFVADTFALIWFGLAGRPHFGGVLADLLLVGALDDNRRRVGALHGNALRRHMHDFVGI